jgi:hypothetical protein
MRRRQDGVVPNLQPFATTTSSAIDSAHPNHPDFEPIASCHLFTTSSLSFIMPPLLNQRMAKFLFLARFGSICHLMEWPGVFLGFTCGHGALARYCLQHRRFEGFSFGLGAKAPAAPSVFLLYAFHRNLRHENGCRGSRRSCKIHNAVFCL